MVNAYIIINKLLHEQFKEKTMDNISNSKKHDPVVLSLNFHKNQKSLHIKSSHFKIAVVSAVCIGVVLCTAIYSSVTLFNRQKTLAAENETYQAELKNLEERAADIESKLENMETTKSDIYDKIEEINPDSVGIKTDSVATKEKASAVLSEASDINTLINKFDEMEAKTENTEAELLSINETVTELAAYYSSIPSVYPINSSITSPYGTRFDPVFGRKITHKGVDFDAELNDPVKAAGSGIVITAEYHHSFGNYIIINHQNGYKTLYAHNSSLNVEAGDYVTAGQVISYAGTTGASTGVHVHFEVLLNDVNIDPMTVLSNK